jgi:uncharacterized protein YjgD (DUF1641 family)
MKSYLPENKGSRSRKRGSWAKVFHKDQQVGVHTKHCIATQLGGCVPVGGGAASPRSRAARLIAQVGTDDPGIVLVALHDSLPIGDPVGLRVLTVVPDRVAVRSAAASLGIAVVVDLVKDIQIVAHDLYGQATRECQTLQEKGYFDAAAAGLRIGDALVQSHSPSDLKQAEASVPQLVGFLRELTRPEVLQALEAIIHGFGRVQVTMNVNKSVFELLRDMNSPDARRGIAILVEFLKVVGSRNPSADLGSAQAAVTSER